MDYADFKDLTRRTASDKILCDKAINIAKNPKYDGCQTRLSWMVYRFFYKRTSSTCARSKTLAARNKFADNGTKNENMSNKELVKELQNLIIRKFKTWKI